MTWFLTFSWSHCLQLNSIHRHTNTRTHAHAFIRYTNIKNFKKLSCINFIYKTSDGVFLKKNQISLSIPYNVSSIIRKPFLRFLYICWNRTPLKIWTFLYVNFICNVISFKRIVRINEEILLMLNYLTNL